MKGMTKPIWNMTKKGKKKEYMTFLPWFSLRDLKRNMTKTNETADFESLKLLTINFLTLKRGVLEQLEKVRQAWELIWQTPSFRLPVPHLLTV